MKKLSYLSASFLVLCLVACSSKEKAGPKRVEQEPVAWDYDKVREVREQEKVQTPPVPEDSEDETNCVVMTKSQMTRAKKSGCRKMDPRQGQGEEAYCCPRE